MNAIHASDCVLHTYCVEDDHVPSKQEIEMRVWCPYLKEITI